MRYRISPVGAETPVQSSIDLVTSTVWLTIFVGLALVLMGVWTEFDYFEVAKIAAIGGVIGVLFTVPLRRALIVEAKLKYPEGVATAAVLQAGEESRTSDTKDESGGLVIIGIAGLVGGVTVPYTHLTLPTILRV